MRENRGFTLVEAMTAMVILVIIALAMIGIIPATYGASQRDVTRNQAIAAGQGYLDLLRQYVKTTGVVSGLPPAPVVSIDVGNGMGSNTARQQAGNFTMTPTCVALSLFSYDCTVTVKWNENNLDRSAQVESYVTSQTGF